METLGKWLKRRVEVVLGVVVSLPVIPGALIDYYAVPRIHGRIPARRLKQPTPFAVSVVCLLLTFLAAIIGWRTHERVDVSLCYLLIAGFAAWKGGKRSGVLVALASSFAAFAVGAAHHSQLRMLWWNLGIQAGILLFLVLLISSVRDLISGLQRRIAERTAALEREIVDRRQAEEQSRKNVQQLRQLAENITDAFWMRDFENTRIVYASPAYERIWGRDCRKLYQSHNGWLDSIHREDRQRVAEAQVTRQATGEYSEQYRIVRPDGGLRWIRDRSFPIRDASGRVVRIVGIAEDITDRRQLELEILKISDREQARIGQDLHDGLCQQLVGLGFDSQLLEQRLAARALPEVTAAQRIGRVIDEAITEARALAHGLFPVQLEADGLAYALQQLVAGVASRSQVNCRLDCPQPAFVGDNAVATHLYRIAQEAVSNAVKHSHASSILVQLKGEENRIELKVSDNGKGIPNPLPSGGGLGLHTMNYRAQAIGGTLRIERGPGQGTTIACSAPQPPV